VEREGGEGRQMAGVKEGKKTGKVRGERRTLVESRVEHLVESCDCVFDQI